MPISTTSLVEAPSKPVSASYRAITLLLIIGCYVFFIVGMWPGVLAEDSLAVIRFLDELTPFGAGKTAFWMRFMELTYGSTKRIEVPILLLASLCVLVLCRIQLYLLNERAYKSFFFCLFFIVLAPQLIVLNVTLIGDGIFAVATIGLFFEIYLSCKIKKLSITSTVIIILTSSFALLTRTNGLAAVIPMVAALFHLHRPVEKLIIALVIGVNLVGMHVLNKAQNEKPQSAIFSLVIWETINFLQPPAAKLPTSVDRVSQKTIATLEELEPLDLYLKYYDQEYWDPLNFYPDGPQVGRLTSRQKKILTKEFFKNNLPKNLAAFMGSRTHVFFASALAYSGLPWPAYTPVVLPQTKSISEPIITDDDAIYKTPDKIYLESYKYRSLLWTPFIAIFLLFFAIKKYSRHPRSIEFSIASTLALQLFGIFFFSAAAEYRYLSIIAYAPLILLPIISAKNSSTLKIKNTAVNASN